MPAAPFEDGAQVVALDELEGDEVQPLIFAAEEDAGDVLVIELGGAAGLLVEAADVLGVVGHLRRQDLQRHEAVELGVAGAEDRRHAAHADRLDQLEMGQPPAANAACRFCLGVCESGGVLSGNDRGGVIGRRARDGQHIFRGRIGGSRRQTETRFASRRFRW